MLSGIVISTTKVSEFLSAMNRVHAPKNLVIPLAVMLRYIPTIQEDWRFIKDAMRLRDVSPSLKGLLTHPGMTVECIYCLLYTSAVRVVEGEGQDARYGDDGDERRRGGHQHGPLENAP